MVAKSQKSKKEIDFQNIVEQALKKVLDTGLKFGRIEAKEAFRKTESRLYAYPILLDNIEQYKLDIEDLQHESTDYKAKDIVFFSARARGSRLTHEEIREGRILAVKIKLERDQAEIDEMNAALKIVEKDEYYPLLTKKYFEGKKDDEIAVDFSCDERTVKRHRSRLIHTLAAKLYGAEAVK